MPFFKTPLLAVFVLPVFLAASAVFAAPAASPRDLPANHWAAGSVKRVLHENIMGTTPDDRFQGDQPVTRYELAVALDRFVRYLEAGRKPLHAQTFPVPKSLAPAANPMQRQAITHLVSNGFLPAASPLVTQNGKALVTAKQLSDALASVTICLSDRAEAPDTN
jgi:hypothetical protein